MTLAPTNDKFDAPQVVKGLDRLHKRIVVEALCVAVPVGGGVGPPGDGGASPSAVVGLGPLLRAALALPGNVVVPGLDVTILATIVRQVCVSGWV